MPSSDRRLPLTAAQRGIWLGQQLDPASPIYNTGECLELAGPLDDAAFEGALRQAVAEAEALRVRFLPGADGPEQAPADDDWPLHRLDFGGLPAPRAAAEDWMRSVLAQPADLERGPLFVQALIRLAPDRHLWYQQIHHAVTDGFGCSLIQRRVASLYGAAVAGKPAGPGFGALRAVVEEDLAYQSSPACERDRAFWRERCADLPAPASLISGDVPAPALGLRDAVDLDPALIAAIQDAARHAGAAWPDVLAGAFAAYLRLATGAAEAVFGLPMMGRMGSAALRVPCMAMNIIPLRVAVGAGDSLAALAARVAAEVRACRPHARYRYEQLRRDLGLVGGGRRLFGPVINVLPFAE
ncbi:MAG TPA: condensation domain-containing protein, partial [Herpetosiphonaceae bacterium]